MNLQLALILAALFPLEGVTSTVYAPPLRGRELTTKVSNSDQKRPKSDSSKSKDSHKLSKKNSRSSDSDEGDFPIGDYEGCDRVTTCATSFKELQNAILDAETGDVVGICGNIKVDSEPVRVQNSDLTLVGCCPDTKCVVKGSGSSQNFVATGGDFSFLNIVVQDGLCGPAGWVEGGGNLQFRSDVGGSLTVVDSEFRNGVCPTGGGGNVDIYTTGRVTLRRSLFENGNAVQSYYGGGAYITESTDITVEDCVFDGNQGSGLGMQSGTGNGPFLAVVKDSVFTNNEGFEGGGIFYTDFGVMQRLEVLRTEFTSNTATSPDGAGATHVSQNIWGASGPTTFYWDGNFGSGNMGGLCPDLGYFPPDTCIDIEDTFTPP